TTDIYEAYNYSGNGSYTTRLQVSQAGSNIRVSSAVARINAAGAIQTVSAWQTEQSGTGLKTFTFSATLGTFAYGDRLAVFFRFGNFGAAPESNQFVMKHDATCYIMTQS